ncbi:MAG: hypothetical protein TQ37_04710 [Candidatus Synechococcus spongiarum 15L]|uniref:Coenzyme A biosynthesis bifunctional protein CoaBC n=1 Tax=Candidatus Synechococcus spongiarum 15L TaxID=1608419 RepID=A0A0G8AVR4_9SYNE|nr:MAG: hypothetical protein TQ37_04710 [Candidatus Synechococcus spongiarum 15L]
MDPVVGRRVLVAVCGSIAAVKLPQLVSSLVQHGAQVRCVLSPKAEQFVSPLALASLSRQPCNLEIHQWDPCQPRPLHVVLAEWAELVVVAPLSATTLARLAQGLADTLLSSTLLATRAPLLVAPAMNTAMWDAPAVRANWQTLCRWPRLLPMVPTRGLLACDSRGIGRLPDPELLLQGVRAALATGGVADLKGLRVLCSAGPTREFLDPVRCLTNPSSGRMGVAMALMACLRGAAVHLVHGPLSNVPASWLDPLDTCPVVSAAEMGVALAQRLPQVHGLVMAAAVADHAPGVTSAVKWPKEALPNPLPLQGTPDLAADLAARMRGDQWVLGFAAEHGLDRARALEKLRRKRFDWIVLNPVGLAGRGFGNQPNGGVLLWADGQEQGLASQDKATMAGAIWSALAGELHRFPRSGPRPTVT